MKRNFEKKFLIFQYRKNIYFVINVYNMPVTCNKKCGFI